MPDFFKKPKPVVLCILDGLGVAPPGPGNAVTLAKTPNLDKFWPQYPHTYLKAAGLDVGLPQGIDGNSEVGHMNIGSGKVVYQDLPRIDLAIKNGSFYKNQTLLDGIKYAKEHKSKIHLMGLVGTGVVHASIAHLFSLIKLLSEEKVNGDQVFLHIFTDGRDSPPKMAGEYIQQVEMQCKIKKIGRIASICGRYFAMDRDERWDRTKSAYEMITQGKGKLVSSWLEALDLSYKAGKTDEYVEPYVINSHGGPLSTVTKDDVVIFFNFRPDRAVQLTRAFEDTEFKGFSRQIIEGIQFIGLTDYEQGFPKKVAFPPEHITMPLGKVISDNGLRQLRIAESEKYPHVTYFLDGGNEVLYPGEDTIEVPSPRDVATYDQKPEMSGGEVTDILLEKIDSNEYDFIVVNYANADMVAHTGVIDRSINAMEFVDGIIGRIGTKVLERGGVLVITSDHGNIEEMKDLQTGGIDTKHSTNPVPFIVIKKDEEARELSVGILADVAPTILGLLGLEKPAEMIGRNLLI